MTSELLCRALPAGIWKSTPRSVVGFVRRLEIEVGKQDFFGSPLGEVKKRVAHNGVIQHIGMMSVLEKPGQSMAGPLPALLEWQGHLKLTLRRQHAC